MDGVININKPAGMTSHDVVSRLRRILNMKKIGHTGTLDPDATGVLPMCVGRGTKLSEMLMSSEKQYRAELTLGISTDTQDSGGTVLSQRQVNASEREIKEVICGFIGELEQIPPMYSAIKVEGKKLYELAREGKEIEREPRKVTIHNIEIESINLEKNLVEMTVDCSKGTYIRTLCNDIGEALGCGGHMSSLVRTRSGRFEIENTVTLEEIERRAQESDFGFIIPLEDVLGEYKKVILAEKNAWRVRNGIKTSVAGVCEGETYRIFDEQGNFLALARQENGSFAMLKTFFGGV